MEKKMFCKSCGKELTDSKTCKNCGEKNSSSFKIFIIIGITILAICATVCIICLTTKKDENSNSSGDSNQSKITNKSTNSKSGNENEENKENESNKKKGIALGDTFIFDDLEITLGTEISFARVNNRYSDLNGKDIIKLPITTKNLKDETHSLNMFYYTIFGSQGTEAEDATAYFDDSIDFAGDLRSGASYTKYLYFVYDGDGEYAIEFDDWSDKITVEFNVTK